MSRKKIDPDTLNTAIKPPKPPRPPRPKFKDSKYADGTVPRPKEKAPPKVKTFDDLRTLSKKLGGYR
jgi:hypothetical protein